MIVTSAEGSKSLDEWHTKIPYTVYSHSYKDYYVEGVMETFVHLDNQSSTGPYYAIVISTYILQHGTARFLEC